MLPQWQRILAYLLGYSYVADGINLLQNFAHLANLLTEQLPYLLERQPALYLAPSKPQKPPG